MTMARKWIEEMAKLTAEQQAYKRQLMDAGYDEKHAQEMAERGHIRELPKRSPRASGHQPGKDRGNK